MNLGKFFKEAKRFALMGALAGLATVGLAACGGDSAPTTPPTNTPSQGSATGTAQQIKVYLTEWAINPKDAEVNAGKVSFLISNDGQFPHDLTIELEGDDAKTPTFKNADGPETLDVDLQPGTYKWYCSIGDHEEKGMVGQVIVK